MFLLEYELLFKTRLLVNVQDFFADSVVEYCQLCIYYQ